MCTEISQEPAVYVIRVEFPRDAVSMLLRHFGTSSPVAYVKSQFTRIHILRRGDLKSRLLVVFRSAEYHLFSFPPNFRGDLKSRLLDVFRSAEYHLFSFPPNFRGDFKSRLLDVLRSAEYHLFSFPHNFREGLFFFLPQNIQTDYGAHTASYLVDIERSFAAIKPPEREVGHSTLSRTKLKNSYSCRCSPACAFVARTGTTLTSFVTKSCFYVFLPYIIKIFKIFRKSSTFYLYLFWVKCLAKFII